MSVPPFQSQEFVLESPDKALEETPCKALLTGSPVKWAPSIAISTVSDVILFQKIYASDRVGLMNWVVNVPYDSDWPIYVVPNGPGNIAPLQGVGILYNVDDTESKPGPPYIATPTVIDYLGDLVIPIDGNGMLSLMSFDCPIVGDINIYPVNIFSVEKLFDAPEFANSVCGDISYVNPPSPHNGELIIPSGTYQNVFLNPRFNVGSRLILLDTYGPPFTPPPAPPPHVTLEYHGFAIYPSDAGKACLIFCPAYVRGVVSFHDVNDDGTLEPASSTIVIDPARSGTFRSADWSDQYLGGQYLGYFAPGDGPADYLGTNQECIATWSDNQSVSGVLANDGSRSIFSLTDYTAFPTAHNYSTNDGKAICLWLFDEVSDLPDETFDPADFNLLVIE